MHGFSNLINGITDLWIYNLTASRRIPGSVVRAKVWCHTTFSVRHVMETPVNALCIIATFFVQANYWKIDIQKLHNLPDLPDHSFQLMESIQM